MVVLVLVGCGAGGDKSGDAAPKQHAASPRVDSSADPAITGGTTAAIQEVIDDFQEGLAKASSYGICGELSARGQAELGHGDPEGCYKWAPKIVARYQKRGMRWVRSKVVSVNAGGALALATVSDDGDASPYPVRFLLEQGEWTLSVADLDRPSGLSSR